MYDEALANEIENVLKFNTCNAHVCVCVCARARIRTSAICKYHTQ